MGQDWRDCIVAYIDLIGVTKAADPSKLMRRLHNLVVREAPRLTRIRRAYTWNDSVLIVALVPTQETYGPAMRDIEGLKRRIDCKIANTYAIAVKGQAFPHVGTANPGGRVTIIEASSWALANCFAIEREAKKERWQRAWYVDIRIAKRIQMDQEPDEREVKMRGSKSKLQSRKIRTFKSYLWQ